jgi:hypothetical protein
MREISFRGILTPALSFVGGEGEKMATVSNCAADSTVVQNSIATGLKNVKIFFPPRKLRGEDKNL